MLGYVSRVGKGGRDLFPGELVVLLNVFDLIPSGKSAKHGCDVDSCAVDAGFPKANFRIHCNTRINFHWNLHAR
jgi:hypothetical protein